MQAGSAAPAPLGASTAARLGAIARFAFGMAVVAVAGAYARAGLNHPWDFETYHFAGTAIRAGLDPYSLHDLSRVAHRTVPLPFIYPPITLAVFVPLSMLPIAVAGAVWFGLKCALLAFLVGLWHRDFLREIDSSLLIAATLLGFGMSAIWDLRTGNVAILEAALIWVAFSSYLRDRVELAAYLIALAAAFKLLPVMLLGLLALAPRPRRTRAGLIAGGLVLLAAAVSFPTGLASEWRSSLIHSPPTARVMGGVNPSALGLADLALTSLGIPASAVPYAALGGYLVFAVVTLFLSLGPLRRAHESGSRREQVLLVLVLWLLLSPRLMVYSFIMAIVPALYVIETRIPSRAGRWVAAFLLMAQGVVQLLPGPAPSMLGIASFLILFITWLLFRRLPPPPPHPLPAHSPAPVPR